MKKIFAITSVILVSAFSIFAQRQAEVTVTSTYLRKSPDYNAEKLQTLQKGEKVKFEKGNPVNGFTFVSTSDGSLKGWILSTTIKTVKDADATSMNATQNPPAAVRTPNTTPVQPANPSTTAQTNADGTSTVPAAEIVEDDNEVLQIDTEEVSLNVRVVNAGNRPVGNLRETAFKVYEDGVLQPVTSVSKTEVPLFNALVIDNSRSLRTQLPKVIEAGKILIGAGKPQDETTVVRFVSADKIEVVQDFTPNVSLVNNALDNLYVEGGQTALIDAVYRTAEMVQKYQNSQKKEDVKLRTLIVVSDGDDRGSAADETMLFNLLRNSFVQIYAIGFVNDLSDAPDPATGLSRRQKARSFLTRLAQETGGKVYFPETTAELGRIAQEISGELRTQYVVSYAPTNTSRDGTFRKIKVEVVDKSTAEKRTAITREGRNAPKN